MRQPPRGAVAPASAMASYAASSITFNPLGAHRIAGTPELGAALAHGAAALTRERQPGETCASELVSSTPAWRAGVERHQFGRPPYTEGGSGARVPNRTGRHLASVRS